MCAPTMDEPGKPLRRHSRGAGLSSPWGGVVAIVALSPFSIPTIIRQQSLAKTTKRELAAYEAAEGRGVGKALAQACEQWAREQGYRILSLTTGAANERALGFYRHMGYQDEDVTLVKLL